MEEYNKIVRDNIPTIIENSGFKCEIEIVSNEEALSYLYTKLTEEVNEFLESKDIHEMADIIEVLYAICDKMKITRTMLETIRKQKENENGGFENNIILKKVYK